MGIYFADEFYKNLYVQRKQVDINKVKRVMLDVCETNKISYIPLKIIYLIIYLVKNNFTIKLINKIVYKN